MAITNYTELQTAITSYMERSDLSGNAAEFIALAEARLNRLLNTPETDATLTGIVSSNAISIASLSAVRPIALFVVVDGEEHEVTQKSDGNIEYTSIAGEPSFWAVDGTNINFDCPLDQAYSFRFRYQPRLALSGSAPTNSLLTNNPDVYLAASIVWGGIFIRDDSSAAGFKSLVEEFIRETNHIYSQAKRSLLTPDPALAVRSQWYGTLR